MSRLEGGLHGLKAYPSARSDDQDFRHGVMLLVGLAWLIVMCNAGSRTARRAGGIHRKGWREFAQVPTMRREGAVAASGSMGQPIQLIRSAAHRPFAERDVMEYPTHSGLMPANWITLAHFSVPARGYEP